MHHHRQPIVRFNSSANNSRMRPQTPQPVSSYYPTFKNFNNRIQPYNDPHQYPNLSKSRLSVNSSASGLAFLGQTDQNEMFPEDLIFLLKNQDRNINNFKEKIEKEKAKVQNDFVVLKNEIEHIIEDLKISVQSELDLVYKTFITKYAELKAEVQEVRKMRKQILLQNANQFTGQLGNNQSTSNKDLIQQIQKDAEHFRAYKIYGYLNELIKQKLEPILELSTDLILIGSTESPLFRNKEMDLCFKDIKSNFNGILSGVYANLNNYVFSPQAIVDRERQEEECMNNTILKSMDGNQGIIHNSPHKFEPSQFSMPQHYVVRPVVSDAQFIVNPNHLSPNTQSQKVTYKSDNVPQQDFNMKISQNEQSMSVRWAESVTLTKLETVNTDHGDSILCIYFIADKYIATGSKDKTINIYTMDGRKTTVLRGHEAAICCLSGVYNPNGQCYLASGSDHGCASLALWDTRSWTISSKIQAHTAAVTSIVDLCDGYHLVTGSYDKKINLYNFVKGQVISTLNNNKTSVTGIVMSPDKSHLITSGLDNGITIWTIYRKNNLVESIQYEKVILNNTLICSMNCSQLRPDLVLAGTRDGKLKSFNIVSGEIEKTYAVNENSVIELFLIERQMKSEAPIVLSCSSKDRALIMTKMETGISSFMQMEANLGIEFGCGIGPKIVASRAANGVIAIASQNAARRQFSLYQVNMK